MVVIGDLAVSFFAALAVMSCAFVVGWYKKRYDSVDVAWGMAILASVIVQIPFHFTQSTVAIAASACICLWALRLSFHIGKRWLHAKTEDPRYVALKKQWPKRFVGLQTFFRIYLVQAVLAVIVSLPGIALWLDKPAVSSLTMVGLVLWVGGFIIESVADYQLRSHVAQKPGTLMTSGLWRYSRHPNYFGELVMWWGIACLSLSSPSWWLATIGAATISILIIFISGIPPSEQRSSRYPNWNEYRRATSVLVPLPPQQR
ncbi:MAG: DUF1295 domain-containing protein [Candidatus Saccharimonas aalborgensis]|jgi:steroid 5-alpha reductase family enzyme